MSLGGFLERKGGARVVMDIPYGGTGMPVGAITQPRLLTPPLPTYTLSSTSRSLGLQTNGGEGEMMSRRGSGELDGSDRIREDEYESRSGSDNVEGGSGDDFDPENPPGNKRNRYHRHTPQQIQDLEALFKECPHPDEKQRLELSKRLCLESRQVKFWFQNRRTQMKTQLERHENSILRQENDKLRSENMSIRDAMRNPMCCNCGGPAMLGDVSLEEQHLRIENARLKDELERVCILTGKFLGRPLSTLGGPVPTMPNSSLELAVGGGNGFGGFGSMPTTLPYVSNFATTGVTAPMGASGGDGMDRSLERSMYLNLH